MIEAQYGLQVLDEVISEARLKSEGVYTAVGTYDHQELVSMLILLSAKTGVAIPDLMRAYGQHLFKVFVEKYAIIFRDIDNIFDFLGNIDSHIHVEVAKLYPDAELPKFSFKRLDEHTLEMIYYSKRKMAPFAEGLILGCAGYFGKQVKITSTNLSENHGEKVSLKIEVADNG